MELSKEEQEVNNILNNLEYDYNTNYYDVKGEDMIKILNLIQKQSKVIDEMAKAMDADYLNPRTAEEIKQDFYRKAEEDV